MTAAYAGQLKILNRIANKLTYELRDEFNCLTESLNYML